MKNAHLVKLAGMLLIPVFASSAAGMVAAAAVRSPFVGDGATYAGTRLDGVRLDALDARIAELSATLALPGSLSLEIDGQAETLTAEEIGLRVDAGATADDIRAISTESMAQDAWTWLASPVERSVAPVVTADRSSVVAAFERIGAKWRIDPVDAAIQLENGAPVIVPDSAGRELNAEKAADWLLAALKAMSLPEKGQTPSLRCADPESLWRGLSAEVAASGLSGYTKVASSLKMTFPETAAGSMQEIADLLDRQRIEPETPVTFRGLAGGLSAAAADNADRIASALYALLLPIADVDVTERHASPYVTEYAAPGFEAIVSGEGQDLTFISLAASNLLIVSATDGTSLSLSLLSDDSVGKREVVAEVVSVMPPELVVSRTQELDPGEVRILEEGREGIEVAVREVGSGLELYRDIYLPENRIIEEGTPAAAPRK